MKKESINKIGLITIFAIAMGFLEATVVVYLRKIYYSNGFNFPLKGFIDPSILSIEWVREFATIIMLLCIGLIAGKKLYEKLAYFIYAFAIWDIFYYVFLKAILNWPSSLLTWDLLFLIPWPWIGPVIAPVLCSLLMIIMALLIIHFYDGGKKVNINAREWIFLMVGMLFTLYTWLIDYGKLIIGSGYAKDFFSLANNSEFYSKISTHVPSTYNYPVFAIGILFASYGISLFCQRMKKR
jgi:hypothetical protein